MRWIHLAVIILFATKIAVMVSSRLMAAALMSLCTSMTSRRPA
jgi:hypothetical protein